MDSGYAPPIASAGPRTIICYICGRQYGVHSYDIHLKQCKDLWIAREGQKPKKERRPLPPDPMMARAGGQAVGGEAGIGVDAQSSAMKRESSSGRGMQISSADIAAMNAAAQETYNNVSLAQCEWCGRSFLIEKLVIHNRSCTQDNPARRVTDSVKRGNSINSRELSSPPLERPKTTSSVARERRRTPSSQNDSLGATMVPLRGSPLTDPSPLASKRGVTRIEPVVQNCSGSDDEYSDTYQQNSPMRGPSGRSLRNKKPSPIKDPIAYRQVNEIANESVSKEQTSSKNVEGMSNGGAGKKKETLRYLTQRVEEVEKQAISLVQSVGEIKELLRQLQY